MPGKGISCTVPDVFNLSKDTPPSTPTPSSISSLFGYSAKKTPPNEAEKVPELQIHVGNEQLMSDKNLTLGQELSEFKAQQEELARTCVFLAVGE